MKRRDFEARIFSEIGGYTIVGKRGDRWLGYDSTKYSQAIDCKDRKSMERRGRVNRHIHKEIMPGEGREKGGRV